MKEDDKKACRYQLCVNVWPPEILCVRLVNWEELELSSEQPSPLMCPWCILIGTCFPKDVINVNKCQISLSSLALNK